VRPDCDGVVSHGDEVCGWVVRDEKDPTEGWKSGFLDGYGGEEALEHGAHKSELGEDGLARLLVEVVQHKLGGRSASTGPTESICSSL
jgi:hypothetical protein